MIISLIINYCPRGGWVTSVLATVPIQISIDGCHFRSDIESVMNHH